MAHSPKAAPSLRAAHATAPPSTARAPFAATMSLRALFMCCVMALLSAPAMAAPQAGSGSARCVRGGPLKSCAGVTCCPGLKCGFSSVGGGFFCL